MLVDLECAGMPYREADNSTKASSSNSQAVDLTTLRLQLLRNGYRPVPISGPTMRIKSAGKRPLMSNWQAVCAIADEARVG